jgi:membrane-bound lytic murein transglycosylase D
VPAFGQFNALYLPAGKIGAFILNENAIYTYRKAGEISKDSLLYAAKQTENLSTRHKVRKGEKLISIAKNYNCTVADLKTWNKLKQNTVKTGTILYVYNINKNDSKNTTSLPENMAVADTLKNKNGQVLNNSTATSAAVANEKQISEKTTYHIIQKGDTLWNISNKYKMSSVSELMRINNFNKNYKLIPGTKIKVIVAG